ncbi:MAG: hypothetical protein MZW92_76790 [Comamonadaceae bacterium]|nr:hypothetical protein [Comamonadaceae bacterium]
MTPPAIRDGFAQPARRRGDAAAWRTPRCAAPESDWLVGINGTRAMTAFNSKTGGFHLTTVGRVQTPTLADPGRARGEDPQVRAARLLGSRRHVRAPAAGEYTGRWFDEKFARKDEGDEHDPRAERLWDAARAEAIRAKCLGKPGIVTEESKPTTPALAAALRSDQPAARSQRPLRLLRQAPRCRIAQALYEKHKVLTYPRTDSRALAGGLPRRPSSRRWSMLRRAADAYAHASRGARS